MFAISPKLLSKHAPFLSPRILEAREKGRGGLASAPCVGLWAGE